MTRHLVVNAGQRHNLWYMLSLIAAISCDRRSQKPPSATSDAHRGGVSRSPESESMKRQTAHLLRRIARRLIAWSNRLDGPKVTFYDRNWNEADEPQGRIVVEQAGARWSGIAR